MVKVNCFFHNFGTFLPWKLVHVFIYITFLWLLVAQNEKLIEEIES